MADVTVSALLAVPLLISAGYWGDWLFSGSSVQGWAQLFTRALQTERVRSGGRAISRQSMRLLQMKGGGEPGCKGQARLFKGTSSSQICTVYRL